MNVENMDVLFGAANKECKARDVERVLGKGEMRVPVIGVEPGANETVESISTALAIDPTKLNVESSGSFFSHPDHKRSVDSLSEFRISCF